jgi:hypothetical protein
MQPRFRIVLAVVAAIVVCAASPCAADETSSLKKGTPDLKSAGPIAFGPQGILFIGDPRGAAIFAIDTGDKNQGKADSGLRLENLDGKIASLLGIDVKQLEVKDMQVNPVSGKVYFSLSRGKGPDAAAVLLRLSDKGELEEVSLKDVGFAKATLPNPATDKLRQEAITHVEYVKGVVYVSGLSNEEFSSRFLAIPFPFKAADQGTAVEIYHGSHGRFETRSPIRTFAAYDIKGETNLLAAYTCTPLVKIPVSQIKPGEKIKGTTVAELGNMNRPLSMFVYEKNGKDYVLLANHARGVMKISTDNIDKIAGITERVKDRAGLQYETIKDLKKVEKLARLDKDHAVILARADNPEGSMYLKAIALP